MEYLLIFIISFLLTLIFGSLMIPFMRRLKFRQFVRNDGPKSHLAKSGTPSMGGIIFLFSALVSTFLFAKPKLEIYAVIFTTFCFGSIGFADDLIKAILRRPLGLRARTKLLLQVVISGILVLLAVLYLDRGTSVSIPLTKYVVHLNWLYFFFGIMVVVGTANAVNLTDGLDGLAAGVTFIVVMVYALIAILSHRYEIAIFAISLAGSLVGFLIFNFNPARIFMGDTGALALGAAVASMAIITETELLLVIIGGVYVLETLSVIMQVISFNLTGKRIFRMSPLHHHFELKGFKEREVVFIFWLLGLLFALFSLVIYLISG